MMHRRGIAVIYCIGTSVMACKRNYFLQQNLQKKSKLSFRFVDQLQLSLI